MSTTRSTHAEIKSSERPVQKPNITSRRCTMFLETAMIFSDQHACRLSLEPLFARRLHLWMTITRQIIFELKLVKSFEQAPEMWCPSPGLHFGASPSQSVVTVSPSQHPLDVSSLSSQVLPVRCSMSSHAAQEQVSHPAFEVFFSDWASSRCHQRLIDHVS